jgi:hypothetical protein
MEILSIKGNHAAPATTHRHTVAPCKYSLPAPATASIREPREKRQAHAIPLVVSRGICIIEFKRIDKIYRTSGTILRDSVAVCVGGKEELEGVDGVKGHIVEEEELVKPDRLVAAPVPVTIKRSKRAIASLGEICDPFHAPLPRSRDNHCGQLIQVEALIDNGLIARDTVSQMLQGESRGAALFACTASRRPVLVLVLDFIFVYAEEDVFFSQEGDEL